jgi:DNA-binding transcriptional MerR regulator
LNLTVHDLLRITRMLKGVQLGQLESLIDGSQDPDDYNPNALRQIEERLEVLEPYIDEESLLEVMALSEMMREASE